MHTLRLFTLFVLSLPSLQGALVLNGGANPPLSEQVTIQPIIVSDDSGANTATFFGTASQQATIVDLIDQIWAQAGIDISWLAPNFWNNTFANVGSATTVTSRPTTDLPLVIANGNTAGVGHPNPLVIDLYFVRAPAGFPLLGTNSVAGLAVLGGNGIMAYVGSALPSFEGGREAIASVIAHEIGHNLNLPHIAADFNLMQEGGAANQGEQLSPAQIATALSSNLSVPLGVPEPSALLLLSLALPLALGARRRA